MMRSGHVVADRDGRFVSVDRGFCTMMRGEPAALIGRQVLDITAPADRVECAGAIAQLKATDEPFEITKRFVRDDGSVFWVVNAVSLVGDAQGRDGLVGTISPVVSTQSPHGPAQLLDCAHMLAGFQGDRSALFDRSLLSNTAWEAMLAAYIAEAEGRAITVGGLAARLGIAEARANRWISVLIGHGVVEIETRDTNPHTPKSFRLTGPAHARLEGHLSRASEALSGLTARFAPV